MISSTPPVSAAQNPRAVIPQPHRLTHIKNIFWKHAPKEIHICAEKLQLAKARFQSLNLPVKVGVVALGTVSAAASAYALYYLRADASDFNPPDHQTPTYSNVTQPVNERFIAHNTSIMPPEMCLPEAAKAPALPQNITRIQLEMCERVAHNAPIAIWKPLEAFHVSVPAPIPVTPPPFVQEIVQPVAPAVTPLEIRYETIPVKAPLQPIFSSPVPVEIPPQPIFFPQEERSSPSEDSFVSSIFKMAALGVVIAAGAVNYFRTKNDEPVEPARVNPPTPSPPPEQLVLEIPEEINEPVEATNQSRGMLYRTNTPPRRPRKGTFNLEEYKAERKAEKQAKQLQREAAARQKALEDAERIASELAEQLILEEVERIAAEETALQVEAERVAAEEAARQRALELIASELAEQLILEEVERIAAEDAAKQVGVERIASELVEQLILQEVEHFAAEEVARQLEAERIAAEEAAKQREFDRITAQLAEELVLEEVDDVTLEVLNGVILEETTRLAAEEAVRQEEAARKAEAERIAAEEAARQIEAERIVAADAKQREYEQDCEERYAAEVARQREFEHELSVNPEKFKANMEAKRKIEERWRREAEYRDRIIQEDQVNRAIKKAAKQKASEIRMLREEEAAKKNALKEKAKLEGNPESPQTPQNRSYKPQKGWGQQVIRPQRDKKVEFSDRVFNLKNIIKQLLIWPPVRFIEYKNNQFHTCEYDAGRFDIVLSYINKKYNVTYITPNSEGQERPRCSSGLLDFQFLPDADESFIYIYKNVLLVWQAFKPDGKQNVRPDSFTFIPLADYQMDANSLVQQLDLSVVKNNRWQISLPLSVYEFENERFIKTTPDPVQQQLVLNKIKEIEEEQSEVEDAADQLKAKLPEQVSEYINLRLIDRPSLKVVILIGEDLILLEILEDGASIDGKGEFCTRIHLPEYGLSRKELEQFETPFTHVGGRFVVDLKPQKKSLPQEPAQSILLHSEVNAIQPVGSVGSETRADT